MASKIFLHNHKDFANLLNIVGEALSIDPALVEKDYWIMHCLYGLQQLGYEFELKGGTSLSKGYGIIDRFSEDIDILIHPPEDMDVKTGRNHDKKKHIEGRANFYDWLAENIKIDGIINIERDHEFDDERYLRSAGIRLHYDNKASKIEGLKEGILLEVGFDNVAPNTPCTISSWTYDYAVDKVDNLIDNRAIDVKCYNPTYTFVEKLQTISTKFRKQQEEDTFPANFMRHYYDVYCLLQRDDVKAFIGTDEYKKHKDDRFRGGDNKNIAENEAFLLNDPELRKRYEEAYKQSSSLYYKDQPDFQSILDAFKEAMKIEGI